MAIPTWPTDLNQNILGNGYSERIPDNRTKLKTDTGPGKSRLAGSSPSRPVNVAIEVTRNEKALLERFWFEQVNRGDTPFHVEDPINDVTWLVKFSEKPSYASYGVNFIATFSLDVFR